MVGHEGCRGGCKWDRSGWGEKVHQALCTPIPFSLGVLGAPSERSLVQEQS